MGDPWGERWKRMRQLGGGGQGETFLVEQTGGGKGVLKLLRRPKSEQARRRMYHEVANLRTLASVEGCAVPRVIDDNTGSFEDHAIPLYMVMEYAEGSTLQAIIEGRKALPLEAAIAVTRALVNTLSIAHRENILHRDLKPANIVVGGLEPVKLTVVDFGLSFNQDADGANTRPTEVIDNHFLSLPEARAPGGDKRDPRSDITAVSAILFYCITGEVPGVLQDARGQAPHRRSDLSSFVSDPRQVVELRSLFDRAFTVNVLGRFQSFDELSARLDLVLNPGAERTTVNIEQFVEETAALLLTHNRPTQLAAFSERAKEINNALVRRWSQLRQKLSPFTEHPETDPLLRIARDESLEVLEHIPQQPGVTVAFALAHTPLRGCVVYVFRASGDECIVFRASCIARHAPKRGQPERPEVIVPWTPIYRFRGVEAPDTTTCLQDLEASVVRVMEAMRTAALGGVPS